MFELMVEDTFSAAHQLKGYDGPCENLHGHTWKVRAYLTGSGLDGMGIGVDFRQIKAELMRVLADLDHTNLNDLPDLKGENPTSENLAKLFYGRLAGFGVGDFKVSKVVVFESERTSAAYYE